MTRFIKSWIPGSLSSHGVFFICNAFIRKHCYFCPYPVPLSKLAFLVMSNDTFFNKHLFTQHSAKIIHQQGRDLRKRHCLITQGLETLWNAPWDCNGCGLRVVQHSAGLMSQFQRGNRIARCRTTTKWLFGESSFPQSIVLRNVSCSQTIGVSTPCFQLQCWLVKKQVGVLACRT